MAERAKPWYAGLSEKERARELRTTSQQRAALDALALKPLTTRELVLQADVERRRRDSSWERSQYALDFLTTDGAHSILMRLEKRGMVERSGTPSRWKVTSKGKAALR